MKSPRAFTLTEMMVAVVVLVVVIIATSKIFGTASQITSIGTATANLMTEAAAIERQFRDDIAKLSNEGFFAIRCVGVRNDRGVTGGPLMNPNLPPGAIIRADQLVFFAYGVESPQTLRMSEFSSRKGQGVATRIYYGHGFQLLEALGVPTGAGAVAHAHDSIAAPGLAQSNPNAIPPWYVGSAMMNRTAFHAPGALPTAVYAGSSGNPLTINATQPEPRKWLLVRQPVVLVDDDVNNPDDDSKTVYQEIATARSIFWQLAAGAPWGISKEVRNGRVDAAASDLNEIRRFVQTGSPAGGGVDPWTEQRGRISGAVYYPRAERKAPSMHRVDQALTNHVISSACSSFIIDWTYENQLGSIIGTSMFGMDMPTNVEHPWFGLADPSRNVLPMLGSPFAQSPIVPASIESLSSPATGVQLYEAMFGYNQSVKLNPANNLPWALGAVTAYTPFPKALRVTMTLHDPEGKLEGGREFQFVVDLPARPN